MAVHSLLQKSAVAMSDLLSRLSWKMWTLVEKLGAMTFAAESKCITSPFGSPTLKWPEVGLWRRCASDFLKRVSVAPQSWIILGKSDVVHGCNGSDSPL